MEHKYKITVGDQSCDGHCISEDFYVNCNKTSEEIYEAYRKSIDQTGYSFGYEHNGGVITLLEDYEENYILNDDANNLKEFGLNVEDFASEIDNECMYIWSGEFVDLLMAFIKLNLPDLEYKFINDYELFPISGGYGLFSR